ncbi:MAG TPA: hypothetical protein DCE42_14155 [Myxococcales bacterium]|nr:hypothetical protein [Deltaproteobacteria bacterium]HAA55902.1 hypothetical protein [Myxococcales bacterium]|tara:strand:+ start:163 stop:441 length:279 start_codon:yes stop_codon:yes gene_type:complete
MSSLKQNSSVHFRNFDEHLILLDPNNALLHQLNEVGARIWELCDGQHTANEIANTLAQEYDVSVEQAREDLEQFTTQLKAKNLVTVGSSATT